MFAQWDDHEITNDWCPGEPVVGERYTERSMLGLIARGGRAFHEYVPLRPRAAYTGRVYRRIAYGPLLDVFLVDMRSYRTPRARGQDSEIFGAAQLAWLKRELLNSRATWKVIAADLPIGIVSEDAIATWPKNCSPKDGGRLSPWVLAFWNTVRGPNVLSSGLGVHVPACKGPDTNSQNGSKFWNTAAFGS